MRHLLRTLLIYSLSIASPAYAGVTSITLNGLEVGIDEQTGCIVRLAHPATGVILDAAPDDGGLLDVAYPAPEFVPLRLASRFSTAKLVREDRAVTIVWDALGPSRSHVPLPAGRVAARVRLAAAPDGRSVILTCKIENHSAAGVPQVLFPDFHGLTPFEGPDATRLRLPTAWEIRPFAEDPIPPHAAPFYVNNGWKEYPPGGGVYGTRPLRWIDFGGYRGGLSLFQKAWRTPGRPILRTHRSQARPDRLRLLFEYTTGVAPDKSWQSEEIWLTPHRGGWAKGIEVFRDYVRTVAPPRPLPQRIRESIGFRTIWMMQETERDPARAHFRYADLPRVAEDAREHGLTEIAPWGWCGYFTLPIPPRKELGTREELLDAVRKARELGVTIAPFISAKLLENKFADRYGGTPGGPAWVYHPELIPNIDAYYLGPGAAVKYWEVFEVTASNKAYQDDVVAAFKEWIDAGITSFGWDVYRCDDPDDPAGGQTAIGRRIRELARAKDPESSFYAEIVTNVEFDAGVVDYTWNWLDFVDAAPLTTVLRSPRLNCNVDDSPRVVKAGFVDNLFLNVMPRKPDQPNGTALIREKPALSAALKEVAAFRRQFLPYFVDGTFLGDAVLAEPSPANVKGYQLGGKLLVIVFNHQPDARAFTIRSLLDVWLPAAARYETRHYGPDGRVFDTTLSDRAEWTATTRVLEPLQLSFFEIQAR